MRPLGFEPKSSSWQPEILPLNYGNFIGAEQEDRTLTHWLEANYAAHYASSAFLYTIWASAYEDPLVATSPNMVTLTYSFSQAYIFFNFISHYRFKIGGQPGNRTLNFAVQAQCFPVRTSRPYSIYNWKIRPVMLRLFCFADSCRSFWLRTYK